MKDERKTKAQLLNELDELRRELARLRPPEINPARDAEAACSGNEKTDRSPRGCAHAPCRREGPERQKAALSKLLADKAYIYQIVENSMDLIAGYGMKGEILYVSPLVRAMLGYEPEELIGCSMYDYIHPHDLKAAQSVDPGTVVANDQIYVEFRVLDKAGGYVWLGIKVRPMVHPVTGEPCGIIAVARDITAWKKTEEELQEHKERLENMVRDRTIDLELAIQELHREINERKEVERELRLHRERLRRMGSELSLAEERERRRIAADLHDHIGQCLAISQIKLNELRQDTRDPDVCDSLDQLGKLMAKMARDSRSLTLELSPPVLYELGLAAALEWLTEQVEARHGIKAAFRDDGRSKPIDEDLQVILFRSVRELLMNVLKHARATEVRVSIAVHQGWLRIEVKDDGVGINPAVANDRPSATDGFGLFSIKERLASMGGSLKIHSRRRHGAAVTLFAPLNNR